MHDGEQDPVLAAYMERRDELERYFRVRLRSAEAAQDLVQDIYLKIARREPSAVGNPGAFLYRLGSNLMLDRIKQERRARRRATAWGDIYAGSGDGPAADHPAADEALAARERLQKVISAVTELSPQVQEAFRLHKLEGLSHAETAEAMGVSRSSVEKYLMASLKRILARVGR